MISLRRKPARAGIVSALTLLLLCAAMLVVPAAGVAAPSEGEGGPPAPQLTFEPGSYDFGLQQVNRGGEAGLQLRNDGEVAAPVNLLELVGPGTNVFWINGSGTSCYGAILQPGESCWVQIGFNPNDTNVYTAQLRVSTEGTDFTAGLSGEGGRSEIGPAVDPTNFGAAVVGSAGVTRAIEVTNRGNYPGAAFIAVIAGGAIGSFHLLDENCTGVPLGPEASCTLLVNFQPLSSGVKTARLGLFGDSEGGGQVTLTGIGVDALAQAQESSKQASAGTAALEPRRKHRSKPRRNQSLRHYRRSARLDRGSVAGPLVRPIR